MTAAGVAILFGGMRVQLRNGKRQIHDGPYADTKDHLGGYFIIKVPSLDETLEWAARSLNAVSGMQELQAPVVLPIEPPEGHWGGSCEAKAPPLVSRIEPLLDLIGDSGLTRGTRQGCPFKEE